MSRFVGFYSLVFIFVVFLWGFSGGEGKQQRSVIERKASGLCRDGDWVALTPCFTLHAVVPYTNTSFRVLYHAPPM